MLDRIIVRTTQFNDIADPEARLVVKRAVRNQLVEMSTEPAFEQALTVLANLGDKWLMSNVDRLTNDAAPKPHLVDERQKWIIDTANEFKNDADTAAEMLARICNMLEELSLNISEEQFFNYYNENCECEKLKVLIRHQVMIALLIQELDTYDSTSVLAWVFAFLPLSLRSREQLRFTPFMSSMVDHIDREEYGALYSLRQQMGDARRACARSQSLPLDSVDFEDRQILTALAGTEFLRKAAVLLNSRLESELDAEIKLIADFEASIDPTTL